MDPQQRLLLETGYLSFQRAGKHRASLHGSNTGVYLGIMNTDYALAYASSSRSAFAATSGTISIAAGRISFALGLQGACHSVDTACSSALVAMHGAQQSLRLNEHSCALAAAVSLILTPTSSMHYARATMLSIDGRCKTLDARANGYVRSEGVGVVVLQADKTAPSDGKTDLPALCGSAVRQDGRSASLTAPNGSAQRSLLSCALALASAAPADVKSIEAHGTGTALGDPTELGSVVEVMGAQAQRPVALGLEGIKASVGHCEPAAGFSGLLHSLAGNVSGNAQLRRLNPLVLDRIRANGARLVLPMQGLLSNGGHAWLKGVSSFGYSGTIAHAMLHVSGAETEMPPRIQKRANACAFPWV
eukprot:870860-Prymnesium_polylepis.1